MREKSKIEVYHHQPGGENSRTAARHCPSIWGFGCYLSSLWPAPDSRLSLASGLQSDHSGEASSRRSANCAGRDRGTAAPDGQEMDLWRCLLIKPGVNMEGREMELDELKGLQQLKKTFGKKCSREKGEKYAIHGQVFEENICWWNSTNII